MTAPLRFLTLTLIAWVGVRAVTTGSIPGAEAWTIARARPAPPPPIVPTVFPPLEPVWAQSQADLPPQPYGYYPQPAAAVHIYHHYPSAAEPSSHQPQPQPAATYTPFLPEPEPLFYSPIPQLDEWPLSRLASTAWPSRRNRSAVPIAGASAPGKPDRLQLSAWALLRGRPGTGSLANGGTLGGSQAGARLTYALDPRLALSLRSYSPVGGASGGEVAAGVRVTPLPSIPVSITAERRQAIGRNGGRSAFAIFAEAGLYQQPLPLDLSLDAYFQGGIVGARSRDLFADGGLTVMRPVFGRFSAGVGMWSGAQPGLYRVDAGPRLSMRLRHNMRVDLDWRQRLAGGAEPGSGPAVTLSGNF